MQTKRSTSTKLLFVAVAVAVACWSADSVSAWVAPSASGVNANTNAAKATFNAKFHPIATRSTGKQHQHQYRYQSQSQYQSQFQYHSSNRQSDTRLYDTNNNNSDNNNDNDSDDNNNSGNGNKLLEFLSPYDSKIPEELREEIYRAEANTPAARDRGTRVALYSLLAFVGIGLAAFNGFLTDLRDQETARIAAEATTAVASASANAAGGASPNSLYVLEEAGFGWVVANPVTKFLFTNKIGGGFSLLLGGGSGLMAEAEFDSKRLNAEKIYEELERRRAQKTKKQRKKSKQKSKNTTTTSVGGKKKRRSGKEQKRLAAISEVVLEPKAESEAGAPASEATPPPAAATPATTATATEESAPGNDSDNDNNNNNKGGVFGKMKELYEKADSMAASQALIMNKNLEEAGLVEKITDETGLKVIGREKAKELEEESKQEQK